MYDTQIHIPQQVENLLSSVDTGNYPLFCNAIDNLKEMIKDNGFKTDIVSYEKEKTGKINTANEQAKKIWKNALDNDSDFDSMWMTINDAETKRAEKVKTILAESMGIVKTYILMYISKVEPKEKTD